jgi:hypothetical protein
MTTADPLDLSTATDSRVLEATTPSSDYLDVPATRPLRLDSQRQLAAYRIAYKTRPERTERRRKVFRACVC